jgi:hypothetical protein
VNDREEILTVGFALVSIEILLLGHDQIYSLALIIGYTITIKAYLEESNREIKKLNSQLASMEWKDSHIDWIRCLQKKKDLMCSCQFLVLMHVATRMAFTLLGYILDDVSTTLLLESSKLITMFFLLILFRIRTPMNLYLEETPDGYIRVFPKSRARHCGVIVIHLALYSTKTCNLCCS